MTNERTALFPGTFDPFTNGHLDLTRRAVRLFERVVVAVAHNPGKDTLFSLEERADLIRSATRSLRRVQVVDFSGLVVDCAREVGAEVMIRGLRAVSDFEFEFQMALMNRRLSRGLEIAYLMPSQQYTYLNSTLVKEVARLGGSVHGLVPRGVEDRLRAKFAAARGATRTARPAPGSRPAPESRPAPAPRPAPASRPAQAPRPAGRSKAAAAGPRARAAHRR